MRSILFVHDYPPKSGGGIEINTYNLSKELLTQGYRVTILSSRLESETVKDNIKTEPGDPRIVVSSSENVIKNEIESHDFTVVMCTFSLRTAMMTALKVLNKKNIPHIAYLNTNLSHVSFSRLSTLDHEQKNKQLSFFIKYLKGLNCIIAGVSTSSVETIRQLKIDKQIHVIHPGVDWSELILQKTDPKYDICFIGELSVNKGVYALVYAVANLVKKYPKLKVVMMGEGNEKQSLISLVKMLKIEKNITLTGYIEREKINEYFNQSKVLVHPSLSESWGIVVVEALGLAREVVVSRAEGLIDSSGLSNLSLTFDPGNIQEMIEKIEDALTNYSDRENRRISMAIVIRDQISITRQSIELTSLIIQNSKVRYRKYIKPTIRQFISPFVDNKIIQTISKII